MNRTYGFDSACKQVLALKKQVDELTAECAECVYKQEFDRLDELERERDYWKLHTDCWADKYKQRNEEANEYANKLEELERENAELDKRITDYAHLLDEALAKPDCNCCEWSEELDELKAENAKLSSDELHWHSEADYWKRQYELVCRAVEDVARNYAIDEGMA